MLRRNRVERFMEHKAISLGLLAATLFGCSGSSFGGTSAASAGQAGAAADVGLQDGPGGASGGQDSSAVGGEAGAVADDSGGTGGYPAAGGSGDTGGAPFSGGSGGSDPTGGVGGNPTGGAAGQDPTGGSGGSAGPRCTKEEAVTDLPSSVTLASWSHTRAETGQCAACASEPCLSCSLLWSEPEWNESGQARFYALGGTTCEGSASAGYCGEEETCSLDIDHTSIAADLTLSFSPCGDAWCLSSTDVARFALVFAPCLTSWGADYSINEAAQEEFLTTLGQSAWECP